MQPERRLIQRIVHLVESRGGRAFKIQGEEGSYQEAGIPDLLVCYRGWFLGLEVKMPGNKPSPLQRKVLHEIEAAGGISAVVFSVEQASRILDKLDRKR